MMIKPVDIAAITVHTHRYGAPNSWAVVFYPVRTVHDEPVDIVEGKNNKRKQSQIESAPAFDAKQIKKASSSSSSKKAKIDSVKCNLKADSFQAAVADGPYLDEHWKWQKERQKVHRRRANHKHL
jgi:hypothetical protein